MSSRYLVLALLLAALVMAPHGGGAAKAQVKLYPRLPLRGSTSESLNWAGYADVLAPHSFISVNASWYVPDVQCSPRSSDVAVWVGMDGFNDSTVEQTGVLVQCQGGKAYYSAWYEFYPASPVYAPSGDAVRPGDKVVGWVVYNPSTGEYRTVLVDVTQGWNFTSPWTAVSGAEDSSAEWVVERPAVGRGLTTLADFGTAYFNVKYTGVLPPGGAYVRLANGSAGNISSFNYYEMIMINDQGKVLAQPSQLYAYGSSFYVCYGTCGSSSGGGHHGK
ncbi:G1 family glutamic endopeptidase [Acidilobus sp.]|uniref:G1 family glutamic endopeptidase n=1 Tax=Acidilobus sp. TaxID=1872109 RepID=UPI003D00DF32